jgi:RNA polymerase sigma-70 factor (ECF subfamily)
LVHDAACGGDVDARDALGSLFSTYWQPLYRYARRKGKSREDAEDLVQGFLGHLGSGKSLSGLDPAKGRFRSFLLVSFQHWIINDWKHASREKRGGGETPLSFDWQNAESSLKLEVADHRSPDLAYDREWAIALLDKVLRDLEGQAAAEGNAATFEHLKPCLTTDADRINYSSIAAVTGMGEGALRVAVHRLRKRYRHLIRDEIARTLASPDAVEDEMRSLFAALAG